MKKVEKGLDRWYTSTGKIMGIDILIDIRKIVKKALTKHQETDK